MGLGLLLLGWTCAELFDSLPPLLLLALLLGDGVVWHVVMPACYACVYVVVSGVHCCTVVLWLILANILKKIVSHHFSFLKLIAHWPCASATVNVDQMLEEILFVCQFPRWWEEVQAVGCCFLFAKGGRVFLFWLFLVWLDLLPLFNLPPLEMEHLIAPLEVP